MRNESRVGGKVPSVAQVAKHNKLVASIRTALAPSTSPLTPEARMKALRFRAGGEKVAEIVLRLADEQGFNLPSVKVADVRADLELRSRLAPLHESVQALAQLLSDTIFEASSEAWWGTMAYYSALQRIAKDDPTLAQRLEPVIAFMATSKKRATPAT